MGSQSVLTFREVDALALANEEGVLDQCGEAPSYRVQELGPLMEFIHLAKAGKLPDPLIGDWVTLGGAEGLVRALASGSTSWNPQEHRRFGFVRLQEDEEHSKASLTKFFMNMKRSAENDAGLPRSVSQKLVAAIQELKGNVVEHSGLVQSGLLVYRASASKFEFVVSDRGIGVLASLKSQGQFGDLDDHGEALIKALQEGVSRFGANSGRGFGFRMLFLGLLDLRAMLRFRSGDHALIMNGTAPSLASAQVIQKVVSEGLFISVSISA